MSTISAVNTASDIASKNIDNTASSSSLLSLVGSLGSTAWDIFVVLGAIPQYLPTYRDIRKGGAQSFSPWICFILLTSNLIRIAYWWGEPFDISLVLQSIVMVIVQGFILLALTEQWTLQVKKKEKEKITIVSHGFESFWKWTDYQSYSIYGALLISTLAFYVGTFQNSPTMISLLGTAALSIEAMLGLPQIIQNYRDGARTLDPFLFVTWLVGDIAKTVMFIVNGNPVPFIACGVFQICSDLFILAQIFLDRARYNLQKRM